MTWSYSGNPASSPNDLVRFLCGDTDAADPLLTDEEITYLLSQDAGAETAAQRACEAIITKLAREVDYVIGPEKVSASQKLKHFQQVLTNLRSRQKRINAAPSWSGDTLNPDPIFGVGLHDNPPKGDGLDGQ